MDAEISHPGIVCASVSGIDTVYTVCVCQRSRARPQQTRRQLLHRGPNSAPSYLDPTGQNLESWSQGLCSMRHSVTGQNAFNFFEENSITVCNSSMHPCKKNPGPWRRKIVCYLFRFGYPGCELVLLFAILAIHRRPIHHSPVHQRCLYTVQYDAGGGLRRGDHRPKC